MNVLFFLPPASRGVDTMAEVVLWGRKLLRGGNDIGKETQTSLSLSAETSDHLNSAWPPRVPPRIGSNMTVRCTGMSGTFFPRTHGPRQIPDDHGGKGRRGVGSTLRRFLSSACIAPFRSSFSLGVALFLFPYAY